MHYSKNIDTVKLDIPDFPDDGPDFTDIAPNIASYGLYMLLQSLDETRKPVVPAYIGRFVERYKYPLDNMPDHPSYNGEGDLITVRVTPGAHEEKQKEIRDQAFQEVYPKRYAEHLQCEKDLADLGEEMRVFHDSQKQPSRMAKGLRAEALAEMDSREKQFRGRGQSLLQKKYDARPDFSNDEALKSRFDALWTAHQQEEAMPIQQLLDSAGIVYRSITRGNYEMLEINQTQPDFVAKLSALMDRHKTAIVGRYGDMDFILTKPDGTALDQEQAAGVITARAKALADDAQALRDVAERYGVKRMVAAASAPRTGRAHGMGAGADAA